MNITLKRNDLQVTAGYDKRLNYAFLVLVNEEGDLVYSNMHEEDFTSIQDFDYFERVAREKFGLDLWDIADAIKAFKINIAQPIEKYKERLEDDELDHLIEFVSY